MVWFVSSIVRGRQYTYGRFRKGLLFAVFCARFSTIWCICDWVCWYLVTPTDRICMPNVFMKMFGLRLEIMYVQKMTIHYFPILWGSFFYISLLSSGQTCFQQTMSIVDVMSDSVCVFFFMVFFVGKFIKLKKKKIFKGMVGLWKINGMAGRNSNGYTIKKNYYIKNKEMRWPEPFL